MKTKAEVELALLKARLAAQIEYERGGERENAWVDALTWVLGKESKSPAHAWDNRFLATLDRAIGDLTADEVHDQEKWAAKHKASK